MAKYLLVYREGPPPPKPPSPEEMQQVLGLWGAWISKFAATGNVVDGGDGLQRTGKQVRPGGVVSDGPFVETKEVVGGYSIIQANDYQQAVAIAKECPILTYGGWIEIRELAGYA